ncbi:MAG: hemolysin family protein, partial [bacterium]
VGSASLATATAISILSATGNPRAVQEGVLWATLLMTALLLLVGEILPKSFAIERSEQLGPAVSGPLAAFTTLIRPLRALLEWISGVLTRPFRHGGLAAPKLSSRELATAVELGHYEGVVDAFEREIINNILEMEERTVGEVMTPRVDVESLETGTEMDEWVEAFQETGFSRLPVVSGDLDHVVGVLYAKDYLAVRARGGGRPALEDLIREPFFIPESMKVLELLRVFRREGLHFALVIDEYGSVEGVVTMEDLLEEIVGDIADSRDEEESPFKMLAPGVAVVFAGWDLEEFAGATGFTLEDPHAETVGGWLVNRLGRIPMAGETVTVPPFRVHVLAAGPARVLWLRAEWRTR